MMRHIGSRVRGEYGDRGVYAVLYAALVVVLIGMGAIVVDLATLRENRREDRSAADSAVIAAARLLDPLRPGGVSPRAACDAAWDYLTNSLPDSRTRISKPTGACDTAPNAFPIAAPATCPAAPIGAPVQAVGGGGEYYITVTWPVPEGSPFLAPDVAPGNVTQPFSVEVDGPTDGCQRIGVAIQHEQKFILGAVLDTNRGRTISSSVGRIVPRGGPPDVVAALNVLNKRDCKSLVTTGGGKVIVGPTLKDGIADGPGIIAVSSDGNGVCSGSATGSGGDRVIDPTTGSGSLICASSVLLDFIADPVALNCDGMGLIQSHALDPGGQRSYSDAAVTGGNLRPTPTQLGEPTGWNPVTELYGCEELPDYVAPSAACPVAGPNHIDDLVTRLGSGQPAGFTDATTVHPSICAGTLVSPAIFDIGSWYVPCSLNITAGKTVIFKGGTVVVKGGIKIAGGVSRGCLVVNSTTCTPALTGVNFVSTPGGVIEVSTGAVDTDPPPTNEAIVYLQDAVNCSPPNKHCFDASGDLIMPRTFVYSSADAKGITVGGTTGARTLWTAPGAGAVDPVTKRTKLEQDCFVAVTPVTSPPTGAVDENCLNSRFARLAYWSEFPGPADTGADPNFFGGQGKLAMVGVFFSPRAYTNLTGGAGYRAASAQFWADQLNINGGAFLGLSPDARTSIEIDTSRVSLIR